MLNEKIIGVMAGLVVGIAYVWFGALDAFFVALFMLAGWIVAKFLNGEIDILALYERFMASRGRRS